jgi:hypothetical protein
MHRAAMVLVFAAVAGLAQAQASDSLAIRGTVLELRSDGTASLPVAGAGVSLIEFIHVGPNVSRSPVATAYTDPRGEYRFHPERTGDYYVEVRKEGYSISPRYGAPVKLDQAHPTAQSTFTLVRLGSSITGRVIDEDGQPVQGLEVLVQQSTDIRQVRDATAGTAADGTFTASDLRPGPHVVRISSRAAQEVEPNFSADDLRRVDQDLETSYWPGGTAQPIASVPVSPGSSASVGTIKIRKVPLYRAHVSVCTWNAKLARK